MWVDTGMALNANQRVTAVVTEQRRRLGAFVRRQVSDASDAETIVQEVFAELFDAYRLMQPIERACPRIDINWVARQTTRRGRGG